MAKKKINNTKSSADSKNTAKGKRKNLAGKGQVGQKAEQGKKGFISRLRQTWLYRWLLRIILVIILLPLVLTLLFKLNFINPVSTLMLGRYVTFQEVSRIWVSIDEIAPVLKNSVIMSEDGKFCSHNGVDWDALNTVIDSALEGEKTRGASTLTMQSVKNLFLWNSRSFIRKGLELPLALYFDAVLSKRRILEIYLNIAEWDEGVFGIEAASQKYFKRSAKKLTGKQASLLTVTLPNPKARNAAKPTRSMQRVANIIAKRARASGAYVKCVQ